MERTKALQIVKEALTEKRYIHTVGVMETAIQLANRFGADAQKAEIAAIFHDYAKFRPVEEMRHIMITQNMASDLLEHNEELWHAPVGAFLVEKEVGVEDSEILDAIKYHTSGRINMTLLDKVIFLADYIEPGRDFPGVEEVRQSAKENLDIAVVQSLRNTIQFLLKRNQRIYPKTVDAYNDLLFKIKGGNKG